MLECISPIAEEQWSRTMLQSASLIGMRRLHNVNFIFLAKSFFLDLLALSLFLVFTKFSLFGLS